MQRRKISQVGQEAVERLDLPPEVAAGVPPLLRICSRAARTSLSAIPCPRREGSTKVWSMV